MTFIRKCKKHKYEYGIVRVARNPRDDKLIPLGKAKSFARAQLALQNRKES